MRVVHCKVENYTHYIGRPGPYGNPFKVGVDKGGVFWTRTQVINLYEEWARQQPSLLRLIAALPKDAVLGCWCGPRACHGDVIMKLWKELHPEHTAV